MKVINGKQILEHGESLRVPLVMMDGVQRAVAARPSATLNDSNNVVPLNRPGFVPQTDAQREARTALYARRDARLADAWKTPEIRLQPPSRPLLQAPPAAVAARDALAQAYANRDRRISEAWRQGQ